MPPAPLGDFSKVGMRFRDATEVGGVGVLLTHIEDASPAAASTLLVGDIITAIDGKTVTDGKEAARRECCLASNVARSSVPSQCPICVVRARRYARSDG